jgi:ribosomal protein L15
LLLIDGKMIRLRGKSPSSRFKRGIYNPLGETSASGRSGTGFHEKWLLDKSTRSVEILGTIGKVGFFTWINTQWVAVDTG